MFRCRLPGAGAQVQTAEAVRSNIRILLGQVGDAERVYTDEGDGDEGEDLPIL